MARIPLLSGSASPRSIIANAQRSVNLYPESNPGDSSPPVGVTQLLTPGSALLVNPLGGAGTARVLYRSTLDTIYTVVGTSVFWIDAGNTAHFMGNIDAGTNTVSISDNGITGVLVDGTANGYWWDLATNTFAQIVDSAFFGADRVCYLDGFFCFNVPLSNQFYLSPVFWNGTDPFDPTYVASKTGGADRIVSIAVIRGELWLVGALTSEVWFNAGGADFPFQRQPGVFIDHGMLGGYSIYENDVEVFWLGRDKQGRAIVLQGKEYQALRVSDFTVETAIQSYNVVNDSIGFVMQMGGHTWYVLTFPTANHTWVLDIASGQWFEWAFTPPDETINRSRANAFCFGNNTPIIGDWQNGNIYRLDFALFTDNGTSITRIRNFPHAVDDGKMVFYDAFIADMECSPAAIAANALVGLAWSDDSGQNFVNSISVGMGGASTGSKRSLIARRLGRGRDRVFQLTWNFPYATALQGAFVDTTSAET